MEGGEGWGTWVKRRQGEEGQCDERRGEGRDEMRGDNGRKWDEVGR